MEDFPAGGDNFRLRGPWRIETGRAWFDWQCSALRARIRASEACRDPFLTRRLTKELEALIRQGPKPVRLDPQADPATSQREIQSRRP